MMGIDFSTLVYLPAFDFYARPITVTPIKSNPSGGPYTIRGIWTTQDTELMAEEGLAVLADQETILDVRDNEFFDAGVPVPQQGDLINIPADGNVPAEGDFEVVHTSRNGGGETTLVIRAWGPAEP
jgi:hypothetical protein